MATALGVSGFAAFGNGACVLFCIEDRAAMVRFLQIASRIQTPVGAAFLENSLWIVAPCHRGLEAKRYLLELEKNWAIG